ncbi:hypothetical protein BJQ90_02907 [Arthrobacter sp. SO3]|nr:hypothetical protein [Arthrobacter sp. SO3]
MVQQPVDAQALGKDPVWVVAVLLIQHALTPAEAGIVGF